MSTHSAMASFTIDEILSDEWAKIERGIGARPQLTGDALDMRLQYRELAEQMNASAPVTPGVSVVDEHITEHLTVRVYKPMDRKEALPVGLYFHGGGFCCGDLDSEDPFCRILVERQRCVIVSVGYRLAPEHKAPAQTEDAMTAWNWSVQNASLLGGDPSRYFTIGQSAGGNLALATAHLLIDQGRRSEINGVVALVPLAIHPKNVPFHHKDNHRSYHECADGPVNTADAMATFLESVEAREDDPSVFVLLSQHLHQFPPTYIAVCEVDPLRDDGILVGCALREAGVPVKLDHYRGLPHVFWAFGCPSPSGDFIGDVMAGVDFVLKS
ncbi:lipase/esteras-like protein [Aspergillus caelatus]|uniref:Lipase/esteras-like protein n=1 Tax=Aspergillus caelatus TaxID=61420 RepID=A0A5N6ZVP3_9EURO|nr:lipase/esteras-like protein [Aspergillus caelatus]KAE8361671.1 lipase/esteras-like protein [Aspergillus caelatus]